MQIGFAGSRQLFEPQSLRAAEAGRLEARVTEYLAGRLATLPEDLGLEDQHLLCGISQLAIGADTALLALVDDSDRRLGLPLAARAPREAAP